MQQILSIVIKASQDFIRHSEEDLKENAPVLNNFYESISNVYIPLLRMMEKLEADQVKYRFALVLPPVLCNMLSDPILQDGYVSWLEKRNTLGKSELRRKGDADSLAGLLLELKGDFPSIHEKFDYKNYTFEIMAMEGRRISRIKITVHEQKSNV